MQSPTIAESLQKKDELRKAINDLLVAFSKETGLIIGMIDIDCSMNYGGTIATYRVDVDVKLP